MSIFLETTYPVDHTSVDEVNKSAPDYIAQHERLKKHYSSVTPSGKNGPTPQEKQAISDYTGTNWKLIGRSNTEAAGWFDPDLKHKGIVHHMVPDNES